MSDRVAKGGYQKSEKEYLLIAAKIVGMEIVIKFVGIETKPSINIIDNNQVSSDLLQNKHLLKESIIYWETSELLVLTFG